MVKLLFSLLNFVCDLCCHSHRHFRSPQSVVCEITCYLLMMCPDQPVSVMSVEPVPSVAVPSSTLTSDEHFKFLSEKKKKPEPKKAKREPKATDPRVRKQQPKKSPPAAEKPKKSQPAAKKQNQEEQNVIGQTSEDRTLCCYCEILYCMSDVDWVQCKVCSAWACGRCANLGSKQGTKRRNVFVCDSCK